VKKNRLRSRRTTAPLDRPWPVLEVEPGAAVGTPAHLT